MMPDSFTKVISKTHHHLEALMNHFTGSRDVRFTFYDVLFNPPKIKACGLCLQPDTLSHKHRYNLPDFCILGCPPPYTKDHLVLQHGTSELARYNINRALLMPRSKPLISKWRKFAKQNGFGSESEDDDPPQDFIQAMEKLDGRPTKRPYKPR